MEKQEPKSRCPANQSYLKTLNGLDVKNSNHIISEELSLDNRKQDSAAKTEKKATYVTDQTPRSDYS